MKILKIYIIKALQVIFPCKQLHMSQKPRSILIIRQHDQLGDFLMSTPVFRELKRALPESRITVVLKPYTRPVAENNPHVDDIIVYQPSALKWRFTELFKFVKSIRRKYDLAIVLNTPSRSVTSDLIAFISGARFRLGQEPRPEGDPVKYDFLYHATAERPHPRINQSLENLSVLRAMGIQYKETHEEIFLTEKENIWAKKKLYELDFSDKPILLLPGANKHYNRWPRKNFIRLGIKLAEKYNILVLWGPGQEDIGVDVFEKLKKHNAKTVLGTNIREFASIAAQSKAVICNDTGDLHICAAIGVPVLGLFGPTSPETYIPQGSHVGYIQSPTGSMENISVDKVFDAIIELIGENSIETPRIYSKLNRRNIRVNENDG